MTNFQVGGSEQTAETCVKPQGLWERSQKGTQKHESVFWGAAYTQAAGDVPGDTVQAPNFTWAAAVNLL